MSETPRPADPKAAPLYQAPHDQQDRKSPAHLWIKQPESQEENRALLAARLCGCSDVCLANIEDL